MCVATAPKALVQFYFYTVHLIKFLIRKNIRDNTIRKFTSIFLSWYKENITDTKEKYPTTCYFQPVL